MEIIETHQQTYCVHPYHQNATPISFSAYGLNTLCEFHARQDNMCAANFFLTMPTGWRLRLYSYNHLCQSSLKSCTRINDIHVGHMEKAAMFSLKTLPLLSQNIPAFYTKHCRICRTPKHAPMHGLLSYQILERTFNNIYPPNH